MNHHRGECVERFEDVFHRIAKNFRYSDFLQFARANNGLGLEEIDIDDIRNNYERDVLEQRIQMLEQWRANNSRESPRRIIEIEQNYRNKDEGYMILEDRIHMFHKSRISGYPYIFNGEQDHGPGRKKKLAIKLLWPTDETTRERVQMIEAKNLMKLSQHQNVISYVSSGLLKLGKLDFSFIAMELCDTRNLYVYISSSGQRLDQHTSIKYGRQLVKGVKHIHSYDIAHRDLKPHNVLFSLDRRYIKIADFGVSKFQPPSRSSTQSDSLRIGSNGYRAPETYNSDVANLKSDIYSLGLTIFFMWSDGKHPFGEDPDEWNKRIKNLKKPDLARLVVQEKNRAKKLIAKLLQKEPEDRPTAEKILELWPYHGRRGSAGSSRPSSVTLPETVRPSLPGDVDDDQSSMKEYILIFAKTERCIYSFDVSEPCAVEQDIELHKMQDILDLMVTDTFSSAAVGDRIFILTWIGYVYETRPMDKTPFWRKVEEDSFFLHGRYPPAAVLENCIYLCGGGWEERGFCSIRQLPLPQASDACEVYDTTSGKWEKICKLNQGRRHHCAVALNGFVFAIGGQDSVGGQLDSVERYDPKKKKWEMVAPMNIARHKAAAVAFQGKLLVLGGKHGSGNSITEVEQYDIERNEWTALPSMSVPRNIFRACVCAGKVYAVGGDGNGFDRFPAGRSIEVFDEEEATWKKIKSIDGIPVEGEASLTMNLKRRTDSVEA